MAAPIVKLSPVARKAKPSWVLSRTIKSKITKATKASPNTMTEAVLDRLSKLVIIVTRVFCPERERLELPSTSKLTE